VEECFDFGPSSQEEGHLQDARGREGATRESACSRGRSDQEQEEEKVKRKGKRSTTRVSVSILRLKVVVGSCDSGSSCTSYFRTFWHFITEANEH
jgi:hypothetical protein